jgi:hypothetical protein
VIPEWSFERKRAREKSGFFASAVEHFFIHAWMGSGSMRQGENRSRRKTTFSDARESYGYGQRMRRELLVEAMKNDSTGPDSREVVSWAVAVLLAAAALIGAVSVLAVIVWAVGDVPGWVTLLLGGGLAVGAAAFAWILARALRSRD